MTKQVTLASACAGLAALAIAGCGSSSSSSSSATSTEADTGGSTAASGKVGNAKSTLNVSETDYKIDPADPTVKSGTVTFDVANDGKVTHNLEVENEEGGSIEEELPKNLAPGDSGKLTLKLPPGTYDWYCPVDGHRDLGMEGQLTVK